MKASTAGSGGRTVRRIAVGAAVIGLAVAGNAAIGLAGDDGRDDGTVPGAPTEAPSPSVDDSTSRDSGATPGPAASTRAASAPAAAPTDNGRGGADPAVGPNAIGQTEVATSADTLKGGHDTDSGLAPAIQPAPRTASAPEAPVDQDVPGAPTGVGTGTDAVSNDRDG